MKTFKILSINISTKKGEKKKPTKKAILKENFGIIGDAHAGDEIRQVSLLAQEDIDKFVATGNACEKNGIELKPGDFAENITTLGINLGDLPIGTTLKIGDTILEVSKIGKECHNYCEIYKKIGDCIMPKRGIFAKVIKGGEITNESIGYYDF